MSTRSIIARSHGDGFKGVYHHWDGYLSGVGATLYNLYQGHFHKDLKAMMQFLIDKHPAGWSTINDKDFTLAPGWGGPGPECYCHGDRAEEPGIITWPEQGDLGWVEYVYVINERTRKMYVHTVRRGAITRNILEVDLDGPEPVWSLLERNLSGEDDEG